MTELFHSTTQTGSFLQPTQIIHILANAKLDYPDLLFNQTWFHIFLIIALALFNGFFVAVEVAFIKLRAAKLDELDSKFDAKTLDLTRKIFNNLDRYIPACKFGASIAGVLLGAVSVPFLINRVFYPLITKGNVLNFNSDVIHLMIAFLVSVGIVLAFLVVIGKVIPNSLGFRLETDVSVRCAKLLHGFFLIFAIPILSLTKFSNWFLEKVLQIKPASERESEHSAEDLKIFVEESGADAVTETEKEILINAMELNDLRAQDIIIPRSEVVALDINDSFEESLEIASNSKHTRFPLIDGHLDETLGQVHIKDLLQIVDNDEICLKDLKRTILRIEEDMKLDSVLKTLLNRKAHIALLIDDYGGASGIITLTNLLEVLVGDIQDEFEEEEEEQVEIINEDEYVVAASMPLHELDDVVPELDLENPDVSTVGGYVTKLIGHLPKAGEEAEVDGFKVIVTEADERKIVEVKFERLPDESIDTETEPEVATSKTKKSTPKLAAS